MDAPEVFNCQQCGDCCRGYGGTFVSDEDIQAIAAFINTDPETFKEKYCQVSGGKPLLAQAESGYCVFWDTVCTIHPVKPRMCRQWPFIKSVLVDVKNWQIMAGVCPGIRLDVPEKTILGCVKEALSTKDP